MTLVMDIIDRQSELQDIRRPWESVWNDLLTYALPLGGTDFFETHNQVRDRWRKPESAERGKELYDSTSVYAIDRLTSGIESLVTPTSEKWHGLGSADPLAGEPSDEEREWFDRYRDYLFAARYEAGAGFSTANHSAIRSTNALGTGVFIVQESMGDNRVSASSQPFRYKGIPLKQCFIAVDSEGNPDTLFRRFSMTARQMVQRFGKVHEKISAKAESDRGKDDQFEVIHAVFPRAERGSIANANRNAPWASIWVDVDNKFLIGESGYREFPYVIYYWQQNETAYGESPVMMALAEIKSLNLLSKHTMRAVQQWTNPPLGIPNDGVVKRPNLNPGKINPGAVDENGRLRIQPIVTAQNPGFIQQVLDIKREQVRETLFINLFQILVQNPQMTATEALIRANEKGQLLGPSGSKIQSGLSRMVDRETGILERKGAFDPDAALSPPESLIGRPFDVRFTSPLDRLRRSNELIGVERTYAFAGQVAQFDPSILDRLDADAALDLAQEINGAPRKVLRRDDEVQALRAQRAQQQAAQAATEQLEAAGRAANEAIPAARDGIELLDELGINPASGEA